MSEHKPRLVQFLPLKRSYSNLETFYRDSLRSQGFQALITSLFKSIWVSNMIGELSKGRESFLVKFCFLCHEATKFGPQRIKSSEVS